MGAGVEPENTCRAPVLAVRLWPLRKVLQSLIVQCPSSPLHPRPGLTPQSSQPLTSLAAPTTRLPARLARLTMVMEQRAWPGPRADVCETRSAQPANTARRAASCSNLFPAKTRRLGVVGPREATPGAGACVVIGRRSGAKQERGWGAPPPQSPPSSPSGPRSRPTLRALLGAPSVQRSPVVGPGSPTMRALGCPTDTQSRDPQTY